MVLFAVPLHADDRVGKIPAGSHVTDNLQFGPVPNELKDLPRWVAWRYGSRQASGKRKKIPFSPRTKTPASVREPATWGTFTEACQALSADFDGIGFVFTNSDKMIGIDLDRCRDPETGALAPWAGHIVERFPAFYWELSPSGRGLHGIGVSTLPAGGRKKGGVEMYDHSRFFAVTGTVVGHRPAVLRDHTDELAALHEEIFGPLEGAPGKSDRSRPTHHALSDEQLLARASQAKNRGKFRRLFYEGDLSGRPSHSEADLALVGMLSYWTQDEEQIDRVFRRSRLMRPKWDA